MKNSLIFKCNEPFHKVNSLVKKLLLNWVSYKIIIAIFKLSFESKDYQNKTFECKKLSKICFIRNNCNNFCPYKKENELQ